MLNCVHCEAAELAALQTEYGKCLVCFQCAGQLGSLFHLLRNLDGSGSVLRHAGKVAEAPRTCPRCKKAFEKKIAAGAQTECLIDVCYTCGLVWYDRSELETLLKPKLRAKQPAVVPAKPAVTIPARTENESEDEKKQAMIRAIHQNSGLDAKEKARVISFIINGPPKPPPTQRRGDGDSWWDVLEVGDFGDFGD